ncbi:MAG: hypothetical protein Q7K57_52835 [Burkholderiaceae bacterium]|nr:hypothetical protein [Burkholderiaceae bacterium]
MIPASVGPRRMTLRRIAPPKAPLMTSRTPLFNWPSLSRPEAALLGGVLVLLAVALFGPQVALPAHYHAFADQRSAFGIPCVMDVLSNGPFVLAGAAGLWQLARTPAKAVLRAQRTLAALFFAGLLLTAGGSSWYHWQPDDAGLVVDRAGMSLAFAGLLGLAVADRVSDRAGQLLAGLVLLLAPVAAVLPLLNGNMGPWAVVQAGGLVLLAALTGLRPRHAALGFSIGAVIALYAVAKGLEVSDHAVFELTRGAVSGHSLKHMVAALAAVPVWLALYRLRGGRPVSPTGQNHTLAAGTRGGGGNRRGVATRTV